MDITKQPYEISLWDDRLVFVGASGKEYPNIADAREEIVNQYFKETKICTIGSSNMETLARCINPKLTQKLNGENTLTFDMYYKYWDDGAQDFIYNPFISYLTNERKVKLRLGPAAASTDDNCCEWFDFIIKNVQEKSDTKVFSYTCKDLFVNELSKTGFELELDNELENNMGTVDTLAKEILEGSDWQLDVANTEILKQYKEEPLYEIKVSENWEKAITAYQMEDKSKSIDLRGKIIYAFYSCIVDKKNELQFLYTDKTDADGKPVFSTDDNLLILKEYPNYSVSGVEYNTDGIPTFVADGADSKWMFVSEKYRGERLVRQPQTKYDSRIDKYVSVYKKEIKDENGESFYDTYYGYTETEYESSGAIVNYVANPSNFTDSTGWLTDAKRLEYTISTEEAEDGLYHSFLAFSNKEGAWVRNTGISGNRSIIDSFKKGEKYVLKIKYRVNGEYATPNENGLLRIKAEIPEWQYDANYSYGPDKRDFFVFGPWKDRKIPSNEFEELQGNDSSEWEYVEDAEKLRSDNYIYMLATCENELSQKELSNWDLKVGLFLQFDEADNALIEIEDLQVFPYIEYKDENNTSRFCVPGGKLFSQIKTKYVYYRKDQENLESISDLKGEISYEPIKKYEIQYGVDGAKEGSNEFTKVRSISGKESNRFNLLQELCETFECWLKLEAKRNQITGQLLLDGNYHPQKFVRFREFVGRDNPVGFRYGVNSKSIQRTIDSAAIVSKMIVKDNANEFAPNGFCSIARATENPTGENFLLNFDHYVRQKLLNFNTVTNDLYVESNGYLGYYTKLKRLNADRDNKIDKQAGLLTDMSRYESAYTTYKTSYDAAIEERLIIEQDASKLVGATIKTDNFPEQYEELKESYDKLSSYWNKWCQCQNIIAQHKPLYEKAQYNLNSAQDQYKAITESLKALTEQKRVLALQFYKKYSRFIQEGSWIKEDYTDPNLYYLDSQSTLHTSAQPKVSYNISVVDVSPLEGYEAYKYQIGDKTWIQDPEFFGWSLADKSVPYREEIIVSEMITELDSPEKNSIKVQNYKTQFEDLFQRITAQTQQAEYHTGEYQRAASVVETNGTISQSTLENSFANNALKLSNARDQSVVWDESGITTTSLRNPSEMVRIISGGVFLSTDGGQSWKTGITGSGINTSYLTAGQINTNEIYIMNGNDAAFRWDDIGLSAFAKQGNGTYNKNQYVRFDQFGIYGVQKDDDWVPENVNDIHENARFALTWDGFSLKNDDGSVRISTSNDIQVLEEGAERIKIGRLETGENPKYGLRIKDNDNAVVMETGDNGKLWLRDSLNVGMDQTARVQIGYLESSREVEGKEIHEIIHAGNIENEETPFVVYEDGKVIARNIEVLGGKIGKMTIEEIQASKDAYEVVITSDKGISIHNKTDVVLEARVYSGGSIYKLKDNEVFEYEWIVSSDHYDDVLETGEGKSIPSLSYWAHFEEDEGYVNIICRVQIVKKEEVSE